MNEQIVDRAGTGANVMTAGANVVTAGVASDAEVEIAVPSAAPDAGPVLKGGGIANVVRAPNGILYRTPSKEAVLMDVMRQMSESMGKIAANLAPSEEKTENDRRRQKEIKKLLQMLQDREIDYEKARILLINMVDGDEQAELARQIDKAANMIKC